MERGDPLAVVKEAYRDLVAEKNLLSDVARMDTGRPRVSVTWEADGLYRSITSEPVEKAQIEMQIDVWYDKADDPDAHVSAGTQYYRTMRVGAFPAEYTRVRDAVEVAYAAASLMEEDELDRSVRRNV